MDPQVTWLLMKMETAPMLSMILLMSRIKHKFQLDNIIIQMYVYKTIFSIWYTCVCVCVCV
jgi:hypothetical protein